LIAVIFDTDYVATLRADLAGQRLGCWDAPRVSHANVLAALANADGMQVERWRTQIDMACESFREADDTSYLPDAYSRWDDRDV